MSGLQNGSAINGSRKRDKDIGARLKGGIIEPDPIGSGNGMQDGGIGFNDIVDLVSVEQFNVDIDTIGLWCFGAIIRVANVCEAYNLFVFDSMIRS